MFVQRRKVLQHAGKHPRTRNGVHDATREPAQIEFFSNQMALTRILGLQPDARLVSPLLTSIHVTVVLKQLSS